MELTKAQLIKILPNSAKVADAFIPALNAAMSRYSINTPQRVSAFLAQIGHESGQLTRLSEGLSYRAARIIELGNASGPGTRWRSLVPRAQELANNPVAMGNAVYGGRMGNGPEASGDGYKFRGRSLLQITGKDNYIATGKALGLDLVAHPELLEQPTYACLAAAEWWSRNGLNALADKGDIANIGSVVNTGVKGKVPNGAADRLALYTTGTQTLVA